MSEKLCKAMMSDKRRTPVSADGVKLRKGMTVYVLHTKNGGKTWSVHLGCIAHTNHRGMVSFESPPKAWHFCWPLDKRVGDHRIFHDSTAAKAEAARRNAVNRPCSVR